MRPTQSTLTPAAVHTAARQALRQALPWAPFKASVTVPQLLDLLLLVAATARTLFAVARARFPFSHETARRAVHANLPDTPTLTAGLARALHTVLGLARRDRQRRWVVAIDTHDVPFYGARGTPGAVGGQRKAGTKWFFRYATAVLLHKRRRYTVGLVPLLDKAKPHAVVRDLLDQIAAHGLRVRGVALDSGFDSGDTLLLLQARGLDYTVPVRRKGKASTGRNVCFGWAPGVVGGLTWTTEDTRKPVTTRVLVWRHPGSPGVKVYAFAGWGSSAAVREQRRAWAARRRYRERFGIETSYRQKNQGRGWTTSPDPAYRLLLEGLAHLLRQVWVRLTEHLARAAKLRPTAWVGALPVADLLDWLADHLKATYPADRRIPLGDLPLECPSAC